MTFCSTEKSPERTSYRTSAVGPVALRGNCVESQQEPSGRVVVVIPLARRAEGFEQSHKESTKSPDTHHSTALQTKAPDFQLPAQKNHS